MLQARTLASSLLRRWLVLLWLGCEFHDEHLVRQSQQMSRLLTEGLASNKLHSGFLHNARELYNSTYLNLIQDDWVTIHELSIDEWQYLIDTREILYKQVTDALHDEEIMSTNNLVSTISHMVVRSVSRREIRLIELSCQTVQMHIIELQQRVLDAIRSATVV
jgi:hypothetical protein